MFNFSSCIFLFFSLFISSCAYENDSIIIFPDINKPSCDKQAAGKTNNPNHFSGIIDGLTMDNVDRFGLNRIFERTASFQEAIWRNNKNNNDYLIILRPAYHHYTIQRVCRSAEFFLQGENSTEKLYITGCRKKNGQWQLLDECLEYMAKKNSEKSNVLK